MHFFFTAILATKSSVLCLKYLGPLLMAQGCLPPGCCSAPWSLSASALVRSLQGCLYSIMVNDTFDTQLECSATTSTNESTAVTKNTKSSGIIFSPNRSGFHGHSRHHLLPGWAGRWVRAERKPSRKPPGAHVQVKFITDSLKIPMLPEKMLGP